MNDSNGLDALLAVDTRRALGQSIGLTAFVWGYPLVESVRTCALQTQAGRRGQATWHAGMDRIQHGKRAATDRDRDVVTPANDLLYTTGWFNLANGPRLLHVPSSARHARRFFVLALYDAWTNNFENPGLRDSPPEGEVVALVGPGTPADAALPAGARVVRSPTDLVWLIGRTVVGDEADRVAARALQDDIRLECPAGTDSGRAPASVADWTGAAEDTVAALQARPQDLEAITGAFFTNLCRALADQPAPASDAGLQEWLARARIVPGAAFDWARLDPSTRAGLCQGLREGVALMLQASHSQVARPWAASYVLGLYGNAYLVRALTAYKGLGALQARQAVYAMGDFDGQRQPLHGSRRYVMRFEPGDLPPVDAFWSLTMYDADRFLYTNPIARFSIGDRTPDLQSDPDGGLSLLIGHEAPADTRNWLPAPAGPFYVILRMYLPREEVRSWRIPPLMPLDAPAAA